MMDGTLRWERDIRARSDAHSASSLGIIFDERFLLHDTGAHLENPRRLKTVMDLLSDGGLLDNVDMIKPRPATLDEIVGVHPEDHIEKVRIHCERQVALDEDTVVGRDSFEVALLAAGAAMRGVDAVLSDRVESIFCLVRPPGHHAESRRSMGYCLFNNVAVAAHHALTRHSLERVMVLDWDAHHGNGTQEIFYDDPRVLVCSLHQFPDYPGSGDRCERGEGRGLDFTVNVPLEAGSGVDEYLMAFDEIIDPACRAFEPELIIVSAGQDAHREDPLTDMQLHARDFGVLATRVKDWARRYCGGRSVFVLEGGYRPGALATSVLEILKSLADT